MAERQTISVEQLRVGMFVHLDMGWMSHPFARSSFCLENREQISTIRRLGLKSVRWDPALSTAAEAAAIEGSDLGAVAGPPAAPKPPSAPLPSPATAASSPAPQAPAQQAALSAPVQGEDPAQRRRNQLAQQRASATLCEAQYAEAGLAWRQAFDAVRTDPIQARRDIESLSQALLDKMLVEGETCIRVLNAASGDRSTAHAMNVAVIAMLVGCAMALPRAELAELGSGAMLHDVGKLDVPERLRHGDAQLVGAELSTYRSHVQQGSQHARRMGLGETARLVIEQHHEQADGSGFPRALVGEAIAPAARIVALINRFDKLCNPSALSRALTPHEALSLMFAQQRARWDGAVLQAFIRMMGVYPAGSVVQLTDERYALVMRVNSSRPLKPEVLVHDPRVPRDEALHLALAREPNLGIRRSIRAAQLPEAARSYLAPSTRLAYYFEPGAGNGRDETAELASPAAIASMGGAS